MTNEELKKKIVEILEETEPEWTEDKNGYILQIFYSKLADALIAAGIGDVWEITEKAEKAIVSLIKQNKDVKHRAKVAERALCNACKDIKDICEYLVKIGGTGVITIESYAPEQSEPSAYIDRAEKELAEEKTR